MLSEICVETNSDLWWSALDQEIKWQTQTPDFGSLTTYTDSELVEQSARSKSRQSDRVSQVYYYSGVRNWTESREAKNYQALTVRLDATGESASAYNSPAIKKIFARWMQNITNNGEIASRYLARFKNPPYVITAELDLKDIAIAPGQHVNINSDIMQDVDGSNRAIEMQVLSAAHVPASERVRIEAMQYRFDSVRLARVGPDTLNDYTSASEFDQLQYGFICDTATLLMSNSDDPYLII